MKEAFQLACGSCGKEFKTPQFPEQATKPVNVTQIIICEPCLKKEERKKEITE